MQIEIDFTCRECGEEVSLPTDTFRYGSFRVRAAKGEAHFSVQVPFILDLKCSCGHISGQLGLGYRYLEEHRPSHE